MPIRRTLPVALLGAGLLFIAACKENPNDPPSDPNNNGSNTSLRVDNNGIPVINAANMPGAKENWIFVATNLPAGLDVTTPGAGRTWDFSKLIGTDQYIVTHTAPGSTSVANYFPRATIAEGDNHSSIYVYMRQLPDVMQGLGLWQGSNGFLMAYSRPDTTWVFPFNYGRKITSIGDGTFTGPFNKIHRTSYDTTYADAWGKLILPNRTYEKTLRVALPSQVVDSNFSSDGSFSHTTITPGESYLWYAPGRRFPVAAAYIVGGNFQVSLVMWDSTTTGGGKRIAGGSLASRLAERGIGVSPMGRVVVPGEVGRKSAE